MEARNLPEQHINIHMYTDTHVHRHTCTQTHMHTTHTITQVCEKEDMGGGGEENQGEVGRDSGDETRRMK